MALVAWTGAVAAQDQAAEPPAESEESAPAPVADGASAPVPGQRVYLVSVATDPSLEGYAQRVGSAARANLRQIEGVDWRHADQRFLGYDDSAVEVLARARSGLEAGRNHYLNLELDQAIASLTAAVSDFDNAAVALEDPQDLADALLLLGAALTFEGRSRDAQRAFERLHVQMPHVRVDPDQFNPEIQARFESARPRDADRASASITVESDPPGAIVYVDYLARGITPLTVGNLVGGQHVVRVTRAGAVPFVQTLSVRPGQDTSTSAYLVDDERTQGLHDLVDGLRDFSSPSLPREGPLRSIAEMLSLERIGLIRVSPAEVEDRVTLELLVFDVLNGRRLVRGAGTVPVGVGDLEQGVEQLVAGSLRAALSVRPGAEPRRVAPVVATAEESPFVQRDQGGSVADEWWFWTVIIGSAVAVGVGVGVGVALSSQPTTSLGNDPTGHVVLEF